METAMRARRTTETITRVTADSGFLGGGRPEPECTNEVRGILEDGGRRRGSILVEHEDVLGARRRLYNAAATQNVSPREASDLSLSPRRAFAARRGRPARPGRQLHIHHH